LPVAGAFVRQFIERAQCPSEKIAAVLTGAGVDANALNDPSLRVSELQFTRVLLSLSRVTRDEFWGLSAAPVPLGTFRTFCRLAVNCRTLGEVLAIGGRFYQLVIRDFALKVRREEGQAVIWLKMRSLGQLDMDRSVEMQGAALFILYQLLCWLADRRLSIESVHFAFSKSPRSAEPIKAYDAPLVLFEQAYTGLRLSQHLLSLPVLADERRMRRFLSVEPRTMILRFRDSHRVDDKVKSILRRDVGALLDIEEIAAKLNMTAVTLRRRLADECGLTYSDLRDATRRQGALDMVADPGVKLEAIASELGYSEYSAFHRAFRRWTGCSPTEFRERGNRVN